MRKIKIVILVFGFVLWASIPARADDLTTYLVSSWTFNGDALDHTDSDNGTLHDGATYHSPGHTGGIQALDLSAQASNGDNEGVTFSPGYSTGGTPFSTSVWIYMTTYPDAGYGLVFGDPDNAIGLYILNENLDYFDINYVDHKGTTSLNTGTWYNVVMVMNGTSLQFYINGNLESFSPALSGAEGNVLYSSAGTDSYNEDFIGYIDNLEVFDAALTSCDALELYSGTGCGAPAQVGFIVQPSNAPASSVIVPSIQVALEDAGGHVISTNNGTAISIAIGTNPGSGTLSGTLTQNTVNGISTFNDLSINNGGTGYTLTASSSGVTGATSNAFNIIPPPATLGIGSGLVGWWQLDEATGTSFADSSGNGNNGTCSSCPTYSAGKFGGARTFVAASNTSIDVPNSSSLNLPAGNSVTICAWVYTAVAGGSLPPNSWLGVVGKRGKNGPYPEACAYEMSFYANPPEVLVQTGGASSYYIFNYTIPAQTWTHLCGVISINPTALYINGALYGTGGSGTGGGVLSTLYGLHIGYNGSTNHDYWNGRIDDVRIYNRELSPDDIKQLYTYSKTNFFRMF